MRRAALLHRLDPARRAWLVDLTRFATVGLFGFLLDSATVYATRAQLGLYGAGVVAYFVAATGNWLLNRIWTFRGRGGGPAHRQWAAFVAANSVGFVLNRGTYAILVTVSALCARQPVFAIFAGAIAGLFTNFTLSRRMVFK
jgi:putative flippase GtrA